MKAHTEREAALLAAVVESSNDAIVTKNLDGVVTTWNPAATRIFGYQPDEMVGEHITKIIPAELRAQEDDILARLRQGQRVEHFDTVRRAKSGKSLPISLTISPLIDGRGRIIGASKIARDISERKQNEERQRLLMNELKHRVKNTLSTVRAIATQTFTDPQLESQHVKFSQRVVALATSADILVQDDWEGARLRDLVDAVLDPFRPNEDAVEVKEGANLELLPRQANSIALALNELATNATKYGALSQPGGRVFFGWEKTTGSAHSVIIEWIERGGPEVVPPQKKGFGSQILDYALKHELNAETELRYAPEGLEFWMRFRA